MERRRRAAGIDVVKEVHDIGHADTDEVDDLILALQRVATSPPTAAL